VIYAHEINLGCHDDVDVFVAARVLVHEL
jgi:hypothetical protein